MSVIDGKETTSEEQACGLLMLATTILLKKTPTLDDEKTSSYAGACAVRLRKIERSMMQTYLGMLQAHLKKK